MTSEEDVALGCEGRGRMGEGWENDGGGSLGKDASGFAAAVAVVGGAGVVVVVDGGGLDDSLVLDQLQIARGAQFQLLQFLEMRHDLGIASVFLLIGVVPARQQHVAEGEFSLVGTSARGGLGGSGLVVVVEAEVGLLLVAEGQLAVCVGGSVHSLSLLWQLGTS